MKLRMKSAKAAVKQKTTHWDSEFGGSPPVNRISVHLMQLCCCPPRHAGSQASSSNGCGHITSSLRVYPNNTVSGET